MHLKLKVTVTHPPTQFNKFQKQVHLPPITTIYSAEFIAIFLALKGLQGIRLLPSSLISKSFPILKLQYSICDFLRETLTYVRKLKFCLITICVALNYTF